MVLNYPAILMIFEKINKIKTQIDLTEPMTSFLLRPQAAAGFYAYSDLLAMEEKLIKIRNLLQLRLKNRHPTDIKMVAEIASHTSDMQLTGTEIAFLQKSNLEDLGYWFNTTYQVSVLRKVTHYIAIDVLPLKLPAAETVY